MPMLGGALYTQLCGLRVWPAAGHVVGIQSYLSSDPAHCLCSWHTQVWGSHVFQPSLQADVQLCPILQLWCHPGPHPLRPDGQPTTHTTPALRQESEVQ